MDKKSIIAFLIFLLLPSLCFAGSVTLAWDAVEEAEGYKIFTRIEGAVYEYDKPFWQGNATTCTIDNLTNSFTYCFVARAFKGVNDSRDSNEVCTLISEQKVTPGKATGIRLSDD